MKNKIKQMQAELANCGKLPLFEIPVINNRNGCDDYVLCDISFQGNSLVAQRTALNKKEANSKKIATTKIVVDSDFSLDENLQELYSACITDIIDSEFYELTE